MSQTKLPEGWECVTPELAENERWYRSLELECYCDPEGWWHGYNMDSGEILNVLGWDNAYAAMLALNEKYPLEEKERGEG